MPSSHRPSVSAPTRRAILRAGALGFLGSIAGCMQAGADGEQGGQTADGDRAPSVSDRAVQEVGFDAQNLVISFRDDHAIEQVNLIGPDGQAVASETIQTGERTVRLQLLDIDPMSSRYVHYTPGDHELVLIRANGSSSHPLSLEPSLVITEVEQYDRGESPEDYGKLAVTITNRGTAPTWVYDIVYEDAPNYTANDSLNENPGTILLASPEEPEDLVLPTGSTGKFVGVGSPAIFDRSDSQACATEEAEIGITVGVGTGDVLEARVSAIGRSGPIALSRRDSYSCRNLSVNLIEDGIDA